MAKDKAAYLLVLGLLCCWLADSAQLQPTCIEQTYSKEIGVREATGHNDGKDVEKYLRSTGLGKGHAWCAAFVKWCLVQCGVPASFNAWAPTVMAGPAVYQNRKFIMEPEPGDAFGIYSLTMKRVSHVGFFHRRNNGVILTVEGNTNGDGGREGDGVYMRVRPLFSIYKIVRWTR